MHVVMHGFLCGLGGVREVGVRWVRWGGRREVGGTHECERVCEDDVHTNSGCTPMTGWNHHEVHNQGYYSLTQPTTKGCFHTHLTDMQ